MPYFGVYIPEPEFPEGKDANTNINYQSLIFKDKSLALDVLRRHKESRLREFPSQEQAENYVQFGFHSPEEHERHKEHLQELPPVTSERSSFHSPTKQELQEFRKQIETGNRQLVRKIVWENPRYLISSGDTPTCLKEGPRYNAMHICAQLNRPSIAEFLLETVADSRFAKLYADQKCSTEMCIDFCKNLLDLYLNMPDKARGETPLHFAAKNGHVDMVEVLVGYLQCKSLPNREGNEPKDIICQRNEQVSPETLKKLELLLDEPYYVPVLRSKTNEVPPKVGRPYSPKDPPNLLLKKQESQCLVIKLTISAVAGPMSRDQAMKFYRRWKTPPRLGSHSMSSLASLPFTSPVKMTPSMLSSIQMTPRKLFGPETEEVPSTPTLDGEDFGMEDLTQIHTLNDSFRERHIKNSDIGKGLEVVGRQLAREEQVEWREYWEFLEVFVDIGSPKGLALLEGYLKSAMPEQVDSLVSRTVRFGGGILLYIIDVEALQEDWPQGERQIIYLPDNGDDDGDNAGRRISEDSFKSISESTFFLLGVSPTKWDMDVLNAIYHVEVDEKTWPKIYAWKTALELNYLKGMERFSSPERIGIIRKAGCWYSTIHPKGLFGNDGNTSKVKTVVLNPK
ncbi:hypothetical protein KR032_011103 [Drosophila birchii]|nr:hypothetical protein KR032_011103 [Drosophila birchii]